MGSPSSSTFRAIMAAAEEEARRHNQFIEPSHFLLAILRSPDSGACRLIQRKVVSTGDLAAKVVPLVFRARVRQDIVPKKAPMSSSSKRAIEQSVRDVMERGWRWNSCDILLGIVRKGASPAADILNDVGITAEFLESVIETEGIAAFLDDDSAVSGAP